jgi:hypothetical protein
LADGVTQHPYSHKEILTISADFALEKNYVNTCINIFQAVFDTLNSHVSDAYKVAPATAPGTIGWNSKMSPNEIFHQLMAQYIKPTPDAVRQRKLAFIAPYNPKDPPKLLFKRCTIAKRSQSLQRSLTPWNRC